MNKYELLYVISPSLVDESREEIINKVAEIITANNGEELVQDKWGIKKLAYSIKFKNEGFFVLATFNCASSVPLMLENYLNINENILRFMIVKK